EARLALEDARLRLEQEGDQPARSLRQITLLIRIFPRHRTRMHKVLERAEHSREDSSHLHTRGDRDRPRRRLDRGPPRGGEPAARPGGPPPRKEGFGRDAAGGITGPRLQPASPIRTHNY